MALGLGQGVPHGVGLLENLFEHEMREPVSLDRFDIYRNRARRPSARDRKRAFQLFRRS